MSNFAFLADEFPEIFALAKEAERHGLSAPGAAAIYARKTVEVAVHWLYKHDASLRFPYETNLAALTHEPSFKALVGEAVFSKIRLITKLGNQAAHEAREPAKTQVSQAIADLFHVTFWLAATYARKTRPRADLQFDPAELTRRDDVLKRSFAQLQQLNAELAARDEANEELRRQIEQLRSVPAEAQSDIVAELAALRAELAAAKRENAAAPIRHDYDEAQTRDAYIDLLLNEAGWSLESAEKREYPIDGMPNNQGVGYADYVLWGDDGKPLAVIEAKRTKRDPRVGQQQAKLYADGLEAKFGQRPVIFYTNGYEHWIWDDARYPPRAIQGFLKKDELALLIERRRSRRPLLEADINKSIVGRYYQRRAISRIAQSFETDRQRKGLLVMATGSGKTRTVIALADLLMKANWAKRILFLADRVALVNQAVAAFKEHLPDAAPVNLVTEKSTKGRVYVSTYPTMMGLIDQKREEGRHFGVGHFDLIIIDEAHRSVYQRYGAIFDYFDSLLVGLTATPRDEIDRNTYSLFELEDGVPTDYYSLEQAVADEYLVPPEAVSVPLKFQREGIKYESLSDAEKDQWDMLEWDEDEIPDSVDAQAINKWLFNTDTVDKVLAHVMTNGLKVEGGDRLGKTIIFAKNQAHAEFIEKRFNVNYPALAGHFARVITFKTEYAQNLIDDFSTKDKNPHIAISVDMLDTGIDVPEVVNLVLFKLIRSKTKFWQILGRGTRLCEDLFGPGRDKECFYVFDFCQNLEFFSQNPKPTEGATGKSLSERLFGARLDLVMALDEKEKGEGGREFGESEQATLGPAGDAPAPHDEASVRAITLDALRDYVAGMNPDNFIVRPHRRAVEKFQSPESWLAIDQAAQQELVDEVAGLPTDRKLGNEAAKRFDLLMLNLQLSLLRTSKSFDRYRKQLLEIVSALEEQFTIPVVASQQEFILEIQTDAWWEGVTVPLLELVRLRLRNLVQHVEKSKRGIVYSDFADEIGQNVNIELPQIGSVDFARFKRKARRFLLEHEDNLTLQKLRRGLPLTKVDLEQLEALLLAAGVGDKAQIEKAAELSSGLGRFIRSLVGLERAAVAAEFSNFIASGTVTADQVEFVELVIEHLTEKGTMDPRLLYASPFKDIAPSGPEQVFTIEHTDRLFELIEKINTSANVNVA
ncbi:DEAD/DEAH box helicase family protein [Devosia sp. MC532]|uniref:DEAD/DEAH box helicase family protein n=1 Tax=Devosia sp. MC532 TaxID=2799788 RepID=UPI0018F43593|nr:DEAD/DEAH box helicase family protein [Devosia sp. MC532]MBJ7579365.1 DEAD/DEAH box helicase family protein [Devosia sp. MC532]